MKKIFLTLALVLCTLETFAQSRILWFRTTEFAWKQKEYGVWSDWSDWEDSNIKVKFDLNKDQIVIFSPNVQIYNVLRIEEPPYDPSGQQVKYRVIDQDDDFGYIRLRLENSGNSQIYVDFANVKWVYNVIRTQ